MFIRPKKPAPVSFARQSLNDLGFRFSDGDGELVSADGRPYEYDFYGADKRRENAQLYSSLIPAASRQIYQMMQDQLDMEAIPVPDASQPHTYVYATRGALASCRQLAILVTGHANYGGVWAWNVLLKQGGARPGSLLEYIGRLQGQGIAVVVLNPNENIQAPDGQPDTYQGYGGAKATPIQGSETPEEHVGWAWSNLICRSRARSLCWVAYNTAGMAVVDVLRFDMRRMVERTAGIGFIDSTHSLFQLPGGAKEWLKRTCRQWETSDRPAGAELPDSGQRAGCLCVSAGNNAAACRELTPWMCLDQVVDWVKETLEAGPVTDIDLSAAAEEEREEPAVAAEPAEAAEAKDECCPGWT